MLPSFNGALALAHVALLTLAYAQRSGGGGGGGGGGSGDGYIGYRLEERGSAEDVLYETETTNADVDALDPEPDVYLNASVSVGEIDIEVDNITAKINLDAQVLKLLHFTAGVDASIDRVRLSLQNVTARVELEARLGNVVRMVNDVLHSIDLNPIVATLGNAVSGVINETTGVITGDGGDAVAVAAAVAEEGEDDEDDEDEEEPSTLAARGMLDLLLAHNILYSVNDYSGQTHTNRVLGQNGSLYDVYLDNGGGEEGRRVVGFYARDMTFTGHNKTVEAADGSSEFELQYLYRPFPGIEAYSWIYVAPDGHVTRTRVVAEATGGGTSTISNDDGDDAEL